MLSRLGGLCGPGCRAQRQAGYLEPACVMRCFLGKAFFKGGSLCEMAALWHTLLRPFEDWRERDQRSRHQ
jgi:hypothetical protein